jgi:hypothetical protein
MVVLVQALADIEPGQELLDEYGERYWSNLSSDDAEVATTNTTDNNT